MLTDEAVLDQVLQALADPSRRRIVERLSTGPTSVSELARPMDMSLAAVIPHIQVLVKSGHVHSTKTGRVRTCALEPTGLRDVQRWINERQMAWERRWDRLGAVLAKQKSDDEGAPP